MYIVKPKAEIISEVDGIKMLKLIERIARVCYKSEDLITETSYEDFIKKVVLTNHHDSVIEHCSVTVMFTVDRGVSHELVRHRIASFTQSSTRYCNYSKGKFGGEIAATNATPEFYSPSSAEIWEAAVTNAEQAYMALLDAGETPQMARSVLPNSLMTEVIVTANLREWKHIFTLRTAKNAHPQMREVMIPLLEEFKAKIPIIYDDIKIDKPAEPPFKI